MSAPMPGVHERASEAVLDEFRLHPAWPRVRALAVAEALAKRLAEARGHRLGSDAMGTAAGQIWSDRGVTTEDDLAAWMAARVLDEVRVRGILVGEAVRRWGEELVVGEGLQRALADQAALSEEYPALLARASRKQSELAARGLLGRDRPVDLDYQQLLTWCVTHLPHLAPIAVGQGYYESVDAPQLFRAIIDEYHYVTRCTAAAGGDALEPGRLRDDDIVSGVERWR